jgi:hypothetical protein
MSNPCSVDADPSNAFSPSEPFRPSDASEASEASRRLVELLRSERARLGDFLIALAEFDRERLWVKLGHASLYGFLQRELGLSNASAFYRKVAAELIQRFPEVAEPLRDGRLCITSVTALARVMTEENRATVLPKFFSLSKRAAREMAVEIRPLDVVPRRDVVTAAPREAGAAAPPAGALRPGEVGNTHPILGATPTDASTDPLTAELCRLHLTVSKKFIAKLDRARSGQGHAQPGASAGDVIEAALDLLLAQQASRRGEAKKPRKNPRPTKSDRVPAAVKRAVWERDQGKCQWPVEGGGVCGSIVRLEIDHIEPLARGGQSTVENCRLACRFHNQYTARQAFGDEWMDQFTGRREVPEVGGDQPGA